MLFEGPKNVISKRLSHVSATRCLQDIIIHHFGFSVFDTWTFAILPLYVQCGSETKCYDFGVILAVHDVFVCAYINFESMQINND